MYYELLASDRLNSYLIGNINSGHFQPMSKIICSRPDDFKPEGHSTWTPMVLASIGNLPKTIMDRCIGIKLKRKLTSEKITRLIPTILEDNKIWRSMIARWCLDNQALIKNNLSYPKNTGNDRYSDNWMPLLTVASLISPEWKSKCEKAHIALLPTREFEDSTQLLIDTRELIIIDNLDRISTQELLSKLNKNKNKIWHQCNYGRPLTAPKMAKMFRSYDVHPKSLRVSPGQSPLRGYEASSFLEAFDRYIGDVTV